MTEFSPLSFSPTSCRVAIHLNGVHVDVSLPSGIPIGALLPAVCDIAGETAPGRLSLPGLPPLDSTTTLAEAGIRDGATLVLTADTVAPPRVRHHDDADALADTPTVGPDWTPAWSRVAALLTAVVLAAVAGFLVVPGPSAVPRLLLCAAVAATVSIVAAQLTAAGATALTMIAIAGGLVAAAGLIATALGASVGRAGVGLTALSIALLTAAGRLAVVMSGSNAQRAHSSMALIEGAAAVTATLGVLAAVTSGEQSGWPLCGFVGTVAAALLLRSRTHPRAITRLLLLTAGICCGTALLVALTAPWACGGALTAAGIAMWLGFRTPTAVAPPVVRRFAEAAGSLAPAAALPLGAWALGLYDAARGIG